MNIRLLCRKIISSNVNYILLLFCLVCVVGTYIFNSLYLNVGLTRRYIYLTFLGGIVSLVFSIYSCYKKNKWTLLKQISVSCFVIGLIMVTFIIRASEDFFGDSFFYGFSFFMISVLLVIISIFTAYLYIKRIGMSQIKYKIVNALKEDGLVIIGIIFGGIICLLINKGQPRWDSTFIYGDISSKKPIDFLNFYKTCVCGHTSHIYSGINIVARYIIGNLLDAMHILNILLYLLSVFAVYKIVKQYYKYSNGTVIIITMIYAMNPFIFGLSSYTSYDQWMMYLLPIVVWYMLKEQWIYHFLFSIIMCFTKETGIISYFGICIGYYIYNCIKEKRIEGILIRKQYQIMLLIGIIWTVAYKCRVHDEQFIEQSLGFDFNGVVQNFKIFYILNFNWILVLFAIYGLCSVLKIKKRLECILIVLLSDLALVIFYLFFNTLTHARYIDGHIGCLCILASLGMAEFCEIHQRGIYSIIVAGVLFVVSNFSTFDPISLAVFDKVNVGKTSLVNTVRTETFTDAIVYNRQYLYMDKALNRALKDVVENGSIVVFPRKKDGWAWSFDGHNGIYEHVKEHWNHITFERDFFASDYSSEFDVYCVSEISELPHELSGSEIYLFSIPCIGDSLVKTVIQDDLAEKIDYYECGGFEISRIKVRY